MRSFVLITVAVCLLSHIPSQYKGVEASIVEMTATHKQPLDLLCNQASDDSKQVAWFKDGTPVVAKENEFEIFENRTLRIFKIVPGTVGAYTCQYMATNGSTMEMAFQIKVRPSVEAFDKTRNVIQGDPLRLDCKAWGIPMPTVTWFRDEVPLLQDNSKKVTLKPYVPGKNDPYPEVENGTIRIVDLDYPDSGNYSCIVTSSVKVGEEITVNATVLVQVKDKYAALWPFLGICAEVAILCTIILIYERRRAKRIEEEERQEEAAHLNANNEARPGVGGDEVRQRK